MKKVMYFFINSIFIILFWIIKLSFIIVFFPFVIMYYIIDDYDKRQKKKNIFEQLKDLQSQNDYYVLRCLKTREKADREIADFILKNKDKFETENWDRKNIILKLKLNYLSMKKFLEENYINIKNILEKENYRIIKYFLIFCILPFILTYFLVKYSFKFLIYICKTYSRKRKEILEKIRLNEGAYEPEFIKRVAINEIYNNRNK